MEEELREIKELALNNAKAIEEHNSKFEEQNQRIIDNFKKIQANIDKIDNNSQKIDEQNVVMDLIHTSEANGKRMYKILIIVIIAFILVLGTTIAGFLYYINTTGYEEVTETAETTDGGNACVGDNCNNGEINYGKGN